METQIASIEWARLEGRRPRSAGHNARLTGHGSTLGVPLARITASDGSSGFGVAWATPAQAEALLGEPLEQVFSPEHGLASAARPFELALWDLAGQRAGLPVYALAAAQAGRPVPAPLQVPCYDTSLYIDDLHLQTDAEAGALIAAEALEAQARGHRAFKIKIGRGARHMPLEEGTRRDIAVVRAVRAALGAAAPLLLDANDGYNLNLAKRVLAETADCGVFWLEEPFREDRVLYLDLREWLARHGLGVLIADGEGEPDPRLPDWAREGVVDVVQYDLYGHGFGNWLRTGRQLDAWGRHAAPHHYGTHFGNCAACHLAGAVQGLLFAEWDEAATPGLDTLGYAIVDGRVSVPAAPGFGMALDEAVFQRAVSETGYRVVAA